MTGYDNPIGKRLGLALKRGWYLSSLLRDIHFGVRKADLPSRINR
jgi:hypothetical protein